MLDDLEVGVDRTDSKLSDAMRRMRKFIRQTEGTSCCHAAFQRPVSDLFCFASIETKSGWCIIILIVVLMILLVAVILI